jgi:hypothetical protein
MDAADGRYEDEKQSSANPNSIFGISISVVSVWTGDRNQRRSSDSSSG